jgi:hypothetical protein
LICAKRNCAVVGAVNALVQCLGFCISIAQNAASNDKMLTVLQFKLFADDYELIADNLTNGYLSVYYLILETEFRKRIWNVTLKKLHC